MLWFFGFRDWTRYSFNFILLISGILTCVTLRFAWDVKENCEYAGFDYNTPHYKQFASNLSTFSTIILLNILTEIAKLFIFKRSYLSNFLMFIIPHFIIIFTLNFLRKITSVTLIFLLVSNFLLSLSCSNIFGNFILLAKAVLRTMSKIIAPIILLVLSLAASDFVLNYRLVVPDLDKFNSTGGY